MEIIEENGKEYISKFLIYCGFELESFYLNDYLTNILGKDGNPFLEGRVEYNSLYEYVESSKVSKSIISDKPKSETVIKNNYFKYDYVSTLIVLMSISLWIINFILIDGIYVYKIAKGFGLNLRIWSIILPLLMCRTLLNGKITKHTYYHSLIGYIYLINGFGHTICHFINKVDDNLQYITGYILMFIVILMSISSYLRHLKYDLFVCIHRLNYLILPLLFLHVKNLWIWFMIGLLFISIEFIYNILNKTQISTLENSRLSKFENTLYLSTNRAIQNVAGSYYRIMVPSINYEWHPFSVSNCSLCDQLLFIVSIRGNWTEKLKEKLKKKSSDILIISGPFFTTSCNILNNESDQILCVAGGIGITPFLSIIDNKVQINKINYDYRSNYLDTNEEIMLQKQSFTIKDIINISVKNNKKVLNVIWVIKEPQNLIGYIDDVINVSNHVKFRIYITNRFSKEDEIKNKWKMLKLLCSSNIECYFYRPNLSEIIKDTKYDRIFFCGPERFEIDVRNLAKENEIEFHCEKFD